MIRTVGATLPHLKIHTADDYLRVATEKIVALQRAGYAVAIHEDPIPCEAYINLGRWVIDCQCGAGNAVDPAFPFAVCVACGALHRAILYPPDREAIEAVLTRRPQAATQNWEPAIIAARRGRAAETVESLLAENLARGVR